MAWYPDCQRCQLSTGRPQEGLEPAVHPTLEDCVEALGFAFVELRAAVADKVNSDG